MIQPTLFPLTETTPIPGLSYFPSYITPKEESQLLQIIDQQSWLSDLKRRVQQYGYKYDYKSRNIVTNSYLGSMPAWLDSLCARLLNDGIFKVLPNQVIVNEYLPGQGIAAHTDCTTCFGEIICSLSLGSPCVMDFIYEHKTYKLLEPRSLLVMSGDARYLWKHAIAARKSDNYNGTKIMRVCRVSLTFREVVAD